MILIFKSYQYLLGNSSEGCWDFPDILWPEVGKITLKSNGDEALSNESP